MGIKSCALFLFQAHDALYVCQNISNNLLFLLLICIYLIINLLQDSNFRLMKLGLSPV